MYEYIERDALLQDIEDSVRITSKTGMINPETRGAYKIIERIKSAAAADVVAVVRCKECIHYELGACLRIYSDGSVSKDAWQERKPDDFCSYGERKEGTD